MERRAYWRVRDAKQAILNIRTLLKDRRFESLRSDILVTAAFERFLEVLSEASRHIPDDWKQEFGPELPWRRIADLGNHIRHAYHRIEAELLWNIYVDHLDGLEASIDAMMTAHPFKD